jgi:predicted metal-dependent hydrolase
MPETFPYTIVRRRVKYARLEFTPQGLKIVAPASPLFDLDEFLDRHKGWIKKKILLYQQLSDSSTFQLVQRPLPEFKRLIHEYAALGSAAYAARPTVITFRTMKNRWGSCSSKGELKFNNNLRFLPDQLVRYIVYHEICHLRVQKHGLQFKRLLRSQFPQAKEMDRQLLGYWHQINKKLDFRVKGTIFKAEILK